MKIISYKGKEVVSKHYCELTDEQFKELRDAYYKKPNIEDVKEEIKKISKGGIKITNITNYFVKDLMAKAVLWHCKWSIEDVF